MSRFSDQQCIDVDGNDLTVKTRPGVDIQAVAALPGVVRKARSWLQKADAVLNTGTISAECIKFASNCFLTSPTGPTAGQLMTIRYVITATTTGLDAEGLILKVGENVGKGDGNVMGSTSREGVMNRINERAGHHTIVADLRSGGGRSENFNDLFVRGSIRLDQKVLANEETNEMGTVTLIHEATHKYAGTIDYAQYTPERGWKVLGRGKNLVFNDMNRAIINADSYAWFIFLVGKM
jgi:hypothetical protein